MDVPESVDVALRRADVLAALGDGPRRRHALVDDCAASKSTVYKACTQLEEAGLVEATPEGLRPTPYGRLVRLQVDRLRATVEARPLLESLPASVPAAALADAEFVAPDEADLDRHVDRAVDLVADATAAVGSAPFVSGRYVALFARRVLDGMDAEVVLPAAVVDALRESSPDALAAMVDAGARLYATDDPLPFGLFVVTGDGERVVVEGRDGATATGLVVADSSAALAWAREVHAERVASARPVEVEVDAGDESTADSDAPGVLLDDDAIANALGTSGRTE
jgi:predicted transcriptional regulator